MVNVNNLKIELCSFLFYLCISFALICTNQTSEGSMSSKWGNKFEIMRDLSIAQGCVPVDVVNTVTANEKPPSRKILEETEEEFYRSGVVGSGDFATPDVDLIKHMLSVVRKHEGTPGPDERAEEAFEISKINTLSSSPKTKPKPLKRNRNVLIESLLKQQNSITNVCNENTNLTINSNLAINKVTDWLDYQKKEKKFNERTLNMNYDTSSMFKKKEHSSAVKKDTKEPTVNDKPPASGYQEYVPSSNAAAYYKKFQECSRMKQMLNEDVWARAERQMKEIDERRKQEAELFAQSVGLTKTASSPSTQSSSTDPDDQKLDIVRLPSHRHDLHNFCVVCAVISKSATGYSSSKNCREKNIVDDKFFE